MVSNYKLCSEFDGNYAASIIIYMQKLYVFSFLLFFSLPLMVCAQRSGSVSGTVTALKSKMPLEFVNVVLRSQSDQSVKGHEVTSAKGGYTFKAVPEGHYYIQASYIGYEASKTPVFSVSGEAVQQHLILDDSKRTLQQINIKSRKAVLINSIDKKVYNVDQDILAKSGSASEILQNVPLVQVDIDGNVSLRNSAVTILINGKVSPLMGKNAAAVLQQLPANSIEKIEVITNPSAKYKPDGTGGIINIVLKKDVKRGLNGTVTGNLGNRERYNAGTSLNYNTGKLNLFGSYSVKQDDRVRTTTNQRLQTDQVTHLASTYQDDLVARTRPFSQIANLGFDYTIDPKNNFGLSGNFYLRNLHKNDLTHKLVTSSSAADDQDYNRIRKNFEQEKSTSGAFYFEHGFQKEDHKIRLEVNVAHSPETEDNQYTNVYSKPAIADQQDRTLILQTADTRQVTLAYENPLSAQIKLEAGYDGQFNRHDLDFSGQAFNAVLQSFVPDIQKTNHFIYNENVQAVYGTYTQGFQKMTLMAGLRGEYSAVNSHLITTGVSIPNHYFKVYPTLHLSYKLQNNKELQLNYSRRVRRPEADELNPFAEYADPTNIRVGNPYLLPELINSVEAGYHWKKNGISLMPGIYYRYTMNRFTSITAALNDSVLVTRQQNLANDKAFGADVVVGVNLQDKLVLNFTPNIFYNEIDATNLGYGNKKSTITWSANLNASYSLGTLTALQLNSTYKSARLTPQGKYLPSFVMNLGAKREVLHKKGSIYVTVSDVFKTQRQEADLQGPYLIQHVKTTSNSRIFYLGFSYSFGVVKKKKELQFDNGG